MSKNRQTGNPPSQNELMQAALPQPAAPASAPFTVPPSLLATLGTPTKIHVLHQTPIAGSGVTQSVFTTMPKQPRSLTDYGGFSLTLHELGVLVGNEAGRMLVPWAQILSVEFSG